MAALTDKLVALGAAQIAFDVDFSAATNPDDDGLFDAALKRATGKVILATFVQGSLRDPTLKWSSISRSTASRKMPGLEA
jgi:CHASE2 domain-containing sensor protein